MGFGVGVSSEEFSARDWIARLARALQVLAETQEPYLPACTAQDRRLFSVFGPLDGTEPEVRLDHLGDLYARARHSQMFGEEERYAPLSAAMDTVRHVLVSHPTLARVVSPVIGKDNFNIHILNNAEMPCLTNLIGGLMARAAKTRRRRVSEGRQRA